MNEISIVELKISHDKGETWEKVDIDLSNGIEESALKVGDLFIWQSEKYLVLDRDGELIVESVKKPKKKRA